MKTIKITKEEGDALVALLDLSVKAGGIAVAGNALFFVNKINAAPELIEKGEANDAGKRSE